MDIGDLIASDLIVFDESINKKDDLFHLIASVLMEKDIITEEVGLVCDIYKRENEVSTGIEDGFGIPHAQSDYLTKPVICFVRTSLIDDYLGLDGKPINNVFFIGIPKDVKDLHLDVLSSLSRKLVDKDFRKKINEASTEEKILEIIN